MQEEHNESKSGKIEKNTAYLNFEVDEVDFDKELNRHIKRMPNVYLPGFRRKAPRRLVNYITGLKCFMKMQSRFYYLKHIRKGREFKLQPVDQPKFDIQQIEIGQPLKLQLK